MSLIVRLIAWTTCYALPQPIWFFLVSSLRYGRISPSRQLRLCQTELRKPTLDLFVLNLFCRVSATPGWNFGLQFTITPPYHPHCPPTPHPGTVAGLIRLRTPSNKWAGETFHNKAETRPVYFIFTLMPFLIPTCLPAKCLSVYVYVHSGLF